MPPMPQDQFNKGLTVILDAVHAALAERGVEGATVKHRGVGSLPGNVVVTLTVADKSADQLFERQEIDDSGQAIDAPAAMKVRLLVSQFVR